MNWTEEEFEKYMNQKIGSNPSPKSKSPGPPGKNSKKQKYNNKKIEIDGIKFDSRDESLYYLYLKECVDEGSVFHFELQPKYELVPKFQYMGENRRAMTYSPDFKITKTDGTNYVVDVKSMGTATQQGELRRKLFEYYYPEIELIWVCRNLKHGDQDGWIKYEDLKKIYRDNKKKKKDV